MIYENIKSLTKQKRLSIRAVEIQAGLGNGVIRGWKDSSPTVTNLQAVAKVLKVPISKLLKE